MLVKMKFRSIKIFILLVFCLVLFNQCKSKIDENNPENKNETAAAEKETPIQELKKETPGETSNETPKVKTSAPVPSDWVEITEEDGFMVDIKYATADNFTKKQIYDCGKCYLRPEAASLLVKINNELKEKYGYSIKVFDCFRPKPYQQRLWDMVPDPDYVTPPNKGSMHSRGLAVDLTIVDKNGVDLDMGTAYDFFGKEAHQDYKGHSSEINKNRSLLKSTMEKYGFKSIRTEWWHYSLNTKTYPLDEWVWSCE